MKHVKRILVALLFGLFMGISIGLLCHFVIDPENAAEIAFYAGVFYGLGIWIGIGITL